VLVPWDYRILPEKKYLHGAMPKPPHNAGAKKYSCMSWKFVVLFFVSNKV
jgi:hypothetical protein